MGATGGGLWKTTDSGMSWKAVTDGLINHSSIGAVAVSASNPDVVYIGTGEADIRGNIIQGGGAYKSTDAGKTWTHIGLTETQVIAKIRVHPTNPDLVYVAAFGHHAAPNADRGVYRSKDGGKTWEKILFRDNKTGANELVIDPKNPQVIYAALWEAYRNAYEMSSGGPGSGIFKSTDGGDHWTEISRNPGLPKAMLGKIGFSVSGADSNRLYAQIEAEDGGFFLSDDAGATWKKVSENRNLRQRAFYYSRVYADPKVKDTVWGLNVNVYKSTDAGKTWKPSNVPHGDNHDMWIASNDSNRMIEANDGGGTISINGGDIVDAGADADGAVLSRDHDQARAVSRLRRAAGQQHGVRVERAGAGRPRRIRRRRRSGVLLGRRRRERLHRQRPAQPGHLLRRQLRRTDHAAGSAHRPGAPGQSVSRQPDGYGSADIAERFQWTFPIVMAPTDPRIIYVGSQHVWKSTNEGQSWERISPDLTRHDPKTMGPSGGPITKDNTGVETYATVFAIAPSAKDANVIWSGSDDGYVQVTRNGGTSWKNVTPKALGDFARISLIEASPFRAGTAYVAANRYQQDDFKPYVFRTDDYGENWTAITNGIGATDFARAIREDIKVPKLLYLGTEHGIYISFDDGAKWESLRQNLPDTPVHDIAVEERDLVIATHGRGFYVMDHIAPLRQGGLQTTTNFHLYKPDDALRGLDRNVAIDYYLKQAAQNVKMEFLDPDGKVIRDVHRHAGRRRAQAAGRQRRRPAASAGTASRRRRRPQPADVGSALSGRDRFPRADHVGGQLARSAGGAGTYQVRVTVDGQTADAAVRGAARAARAEGRHRSGSARGVRSRDQGARQGQPGQRSGAAGPRHQAADRGAQGQARREVRQRRQGARRVRGAVERDRGRDLPGQAAEQPGSAELPDQVEQQDRGAAGRDRERRRPADRAGVFRVPHAVERPRRAAREAGYAT